MKRRMAETVREGIALAAILGLPLMAEAAAPYVGKQPPPDPLLFGGRCTIVGREKVTDNRFALFATCDNDRIFKTKLVHLENDKWLLEHSPDNVSLIETK